MREDEQDAAADGSGAAQAVPSEQTSTPKPSKGALSHFLELSADDESTTSKLSARQARKSIGGIALHAIGAQVSAITHKVAPQFGPGAAEAAEAPATVHGAPENAQQSRELLARLKRMDAFDTQNFDTTDNDIEREMQMNREYIDYTTEESWRWAIAFLIGVSMGVLGFAVDWAVVTLNTWKFGTTRAVIQAAGGGGVLPYLTFCAFSVGFVAVSGSLVSWGAPLAAGSGIPEIKTYLNGVRIRGLLAIRTLCCKLVAVAFSMGGGLIAGKDGPLIHAGGIVGGGLAGMGSRTLTKVLGFPVAAPRACGGFFRNDAEHRDFVLIGTAAGLASAFSTPIGGLLLAIEQGSSFLTIGLFWRGFLATCTTTVVLHFLAFFKSSPASPWALKLGIRRELGLYADSIARRGAHYFFYAWELPVFVLMGCVGGLLGAAWIRINVEMIRVRAKHVPARLPFRRLLEVVAVGWLIATVYFIICRASPCRQLPSRQALGYYEAESEVDDFYAGGTLPDSRGLKHFPRLWCKEGEYSTLGQLFFTPLIQQVRLVIQLGVTLPAELASEARDISVGSLILMTVVLFACSLISFGIGAPTGLFVAMLAIGGGWGRLVGLAVQRIVGGVSALPVSLPAYTIVGAAAMLGGVTRMTVSITVLVMEATGGLQVLVPLMLAVFFAKLVGDAVGLSVYDTHIKIKGAPVLPEADMQLRQAMVADKLTAEELMSTSLVALPPVVPLRRLLHVLSTCRHASFPVTEDPAAAATPGQAFELMGVIARDTLLRLLRARIGLVPQPQDGQQAADWRHLVPDTQAERLAVLEELQQIPLKLRAEQQQPLIFAELTAAERDMALDLRPYMERTPFVVCGLAPLARAYRLFRGLGLHHLFVGPSRPLVSGLLTRKDLVEETCELVLGERANTTQEPLVRQASALAALPFVPYHADELRRRRKGRPLRSAYAADSGGGEGEEGGEAGEREGDWGAANVRDQQPASNGRGGCALSRGGGSMELASIVEGREDGGYGDEEEGFGGTAESEDVRLLRHMAHS